METNIACLVVYSQQQSSHQARKYLDKNKFARLEVRVFLCKGFAGPQFQMSKESPVNTNLSAAGGLLMPG